MIEKEHQIMPQILGLERTLISPPYLSEVDAVPRDLLSFPGKCVYVRSSTRYTNHSVHRLLAPRENKKPRVQGLMKS